MNGLRFGTVEDELRAARRSKPHSGKWSEGVTELPTEAGGGRLPGLFQPSAAPKRSELPKPRRYERYPHARWLPMEIRAERQEKFEICITTRKTFRLFPYFKYTLRIELPSCKEEVLRCGLSTARASTRFQCSPRCWGYVALPRWYARSIPQPRSDADTFHRLVWLNNWIEAAALLERTSPRPAVDPLLAQAVMLRGNLEKIALPTAGAEIAAIIEKAGANENPSVFLQLLAIKGDIEFQLDLSRAEATWMQVQELANKAGPSEWKARANGELGAIAFLKGQPIRALNLVARAYLAAELNGDVAAQIRLRTALGEGLAEFGRNDDALQFFQRALDLANATPVAYFPFTAFVGKARILATTGRSDDAMKMLRDGLLESRAKGFAIREARIVTTLSDLAEKRGDRDEALGWLKQAAALAERAGLRRIESAAATRLSRLHREIGDKAGAARFARQSVHAARLSGDAYHLPQLLAELAESEAAIGNVREAEATFEHASDLVDSLLSSALGKSDPLCCALHKGSYVESRIMLSSGPPWSNQSVLCAYSWLRTLHNHKAVRKAISWSPGLKRPGPMSAGANLPKAFSIIVRSASTYP